MDPGLASRERGDLGEGAGMSESEVLGFFRAAVRTGDAASMRAGLERLFGLTGGEGVSAAEEYLLRHPDYVMEMPQSRE
jgi:hypothetical protein